MQGRSAGQDFLKRKTCVEAEGRLALRSVSSSAAVVSTNFLRPPPPAPPDPTTR